MRYAGGACLDRCAWRRDASQQTCDRKIFVDGGPMNSEACPGQLPTITLFRSRMKQSRVPHERHADRAAIEKIDDQAVFSTMYVAYAGSRAKFGSIHSKPSTTCLILRHHSFDGAQFVRRVAD